MTPQKVCNWEKFGHCKFREECSDYHPKDVCLEKLCNIVKCMKRHPKQCIYFGSGSCKYGDSCKYNHGPDLRELLQKSIEEHKNKDKIIKEFLETLKILNEKVTDLERNVEELFDVCIYSEMEIRFADVENKVDYITNILPEKIKNFKNQNEVNERSNESHEMIEDTFACDDSSNKTEAQNTVNQVSTENYVRREIEFSVEIQRKLRERVSAIWKEKFDKNRKSLENFKENLNTNFKKMTKEVSLPLHKFRKYEDVITKFNAKCYEIMNKKITKNDKTSIFKRTMKTNYETLINEIIQIRNLK